MIGLFNLLRIKGKEYFNILVGVLGNKSSFVCLYLIDCCVTKLKRFELTQHHMQMFQLN